MGGRSWGFAENDVWTVGNDGSITHWDGTGWRPSDSGTNERLFGIWGASADDLWAVGDNGTLLHRKR